MSQAPANRWIILIASLLCNVCIGAAYAWSVFQKPLITMFNWSTTEASLAFTFSLSLVPIAMIIAGKIQDQHGPKKIIFVGGIMYSAALFFAGYTDSLTILYATYGVLGGLAIGTVYGSAVTNTVRFFPDKRGLASGLAVAGFGSGAVIIAPVASSLIASYGVLATFKILGVVFLFIICGCSLLITQPPANYKPAGWNPPAPSASTPVTIDKNWREMVADPVFYLLMVVYILGSVSGLMIIGHASPIGQELIKLTPQTAAAAVGLMALANTIGRIFWGFVSDKFGRLVALMFMFILSGSMMFALTSVTTYLPFLLVLMTIGLCYGGVLGVFPSITADFFGAKNLSMNYGIIFLGFGIAALIGPRLAAKVKEANAGDYSQAFLIAAGLCVLGLVLVFIAQQIMKKRAAAVSK